MLLVADVHGASDALRRVASADAQLLVLGDLINFIDYRTFDGIVASVVGTEVVREMVRLRGLRRWEDARRVWREAHSGPPDEVAARYASATEEAYGEVCPALEGSGAIVTYGNADDPRRLAEALPGDCVFVGDAATVQVEGLTVGIVGGGSATPLGVAGEISDEEMARRIDSLGPVDVLCTHVAPAGVPLSDDVIGGRHKGSAPLLDYIERAQPAFHYFGDIHQPQATTWRIGSTVCHNLGYFRATGRAVEHRGRG